MNTPSMNAGPRAGGGGNKRLEAGESSRLFVGNLHNACLLQ